MAYIVTGSISKEREFPRTFHRKGFNEYYSKARIYVTIDGKTVTDQNLIRETTAISLGLASLQLDPNTKVVWSGKQKAFVVQSEIKSRDVVVTIMEEIKSEKSNTGAGASG